MTPIGQALRRAVMRAEHWIVNLEWLAWLVLLVSLSAGLGQDIGSSPAPGGGGVGVGLRWADATMTALVCAAALVQAWTQLRYPAHGGPMERMARWMMVCVSLVFAARFTWMLAVLGDIYAPPVTIGAFTVYALAQILHSLAVVGQEQGADLADRRRQRRRATDRSTA